MGLNGSRNDDDSEHGLCSFGLPLSSTLNHQYHSFYTSKSAGPGEWPIKKELIKLQPLSYFENKTDPFQCNSDSKATASLRAAVIFQAVALFLLTATPSGSTYSTALTSQKRTHWGSPMGAQNFLDQVHAHNSSLLALSVGWWILGKCRTLWGPSSVVLRFLFPQGVGVRQLLLIHLNQLL